MRIRDPPVYAIVFYFILFSSLIVHEAGHIFAGERVTKDCIFTETWFSFDFLVLRRSGMTYFTCSHGVDRYDRPIVDLEWEDITFPKVKVKVAEAGGVRQVTSPLSTGWFTALMGPAMELVYVTWVIHWLSRRYMQIRVIKASYLLFLFMVFASSRGDFSQAIPEEHASLFIIGYFLTFMVVALTHITFNIEYYRSLLCSMPYSMRKNVRLKC
jgi:hypothetical protein